MSSKAEQSKQIMGVLNLSHDSFSGDGLGALQETELRERIEVLLSEGAQIIDIGAVASGPKSVEVSEEEELRRLSLVSNVDLLSGYDLICRFSVDTYRSSAAEHMLKSGASIVNDISALRYDARMASLCAEHKAQVVLMFSKEAAGHPRVTSTQRNYTNILQDIISFFDERMNYAVSLGIAENDIILDPGMGAFLGTDAELSWEVVRSASSLVARFPNNRILYGVSRKGFLTNSKDLFVRDAMSKLVELELLEQGVSIVRTHNVALLSEAMRARNSLRS